MQTQSLHTQNLRRIVEHYTSFPCAFLANQNTTEGKDHFIVYGESLDLALLQRFQQKCGENFAFFHRTLPSYLLIHINFHFNRHARNNTF